MSYCRQIGKDKIIFATKEDHEIPSTVTLPEPDPAPGLILSNGEINWTCPCLGGMATGPCGVEFRNAFSCFHYSEAEPKGSDCIEAFQTMQNCMLKYPTLYNKKDDQNEAVDVIDSANSSGEKEISNNHSNTDNLEQEEEKLVNLIETKE